MAYKLTLGGIRSLLKMTTRDGADPSCQCNQQSCCWCFQVFGPPNEFLSVNFFLNEYLQTIANKIIDGILYFSEE